MMIRLLSAAVALSFSVLSGITVAHASSWQESILRMPVYSSQSMTQQTYAAPAKKARGARKAKSNASKRTRVASLTNSYSSSASGGSVSSGLASYYWQPQRVASGGWFNPNAMTAAHKTLPFGTRVRVTNLRNGRSVVVTINDRGPFIAGRVIDLSKAAAGVIGMQQAGVVPVSIARL